MPISSARSVGTFRVRSPWVIRRTKYLFLAPSGIVIVSVPSITAAPWWGYTTLSPTLKGTRSLLLAQRGPQGCHLGTASPHSAVVTGGSAIMAAMGELLVAVAACVAIAAVLVPWLLGQRGGESLASVAARHGLQHSASDPFGSTRVAFPLFRKG